MCTGQMARADSFCRVRPAPFLLKMRCASEPSHSLSQGSVPLPQTEPSGGQGRFGDLLQAGKWAPKMDGCWVSCPRGISELFCELGVAGSER